MMIHFGSLVESNVLIGVSDPWDFEKVVGSSVLRGKIKAVYTTAHIRKGFENYTESLLLQILKPFAYKELKAEYFLASPSHVGKGLVQLTQSEAVPLNFIRASSQRAESDRTFDDSYWKTEKSFFVIGGLEIEAPNKSVESDQAT